MAEKTTEITEETDGSQLTTEFTLGEQECSICGDALSVSGHTKEVLFANIKEAGWKNLNSDHYGQIGYWCGCDYEH